MEGEMDQDPEPHQVQKMEVEEEGDDEVGGGDISELEPTAGTEMDMGTPRVDQLLEENRQLKATVEEQRASLEQMKKLKNKANRKLKATVEEQLGQMEELKKENKELKGSLKTTRQMLEGKWKGMRMELSALREEEGQLVEQVETLKKTLGRMTRVFVSKLEELRELTVKEDELKSGKVNMSPYLKLIGEVIGEQWMGPRPGRRAAAEILPEEVWKMIFGNVSDPKDLWNLCNTCQLFDNILSPWKTGWMLEQSLPYLYQHLPGNKLLGSRLVCKSWKRTVDQYLDDHHSQRPHDAEKYDPRRLDFVNPMKEKQLGEDYFLNLDNNFHMSLLNDSEFTEKWKQTAILGRRITLRLGGDCDDEDDSSDDEDDSSDDEEDQVKHTFEEMWEKFYKLLGHIGSEVWYLNVRCNSSQEDRVKWEQRILQFLTVELLAIFPHLRKLSVRVLGINSEEPIDPQLFPPAPNLETLESTCWGGIVEDGMLKRYHAQLRCLLCPRASWYILGPELTWPNLTELHLYGFNGDEDFLELFEGLKLPHLAKLGLNLGDLTDNNASAFRSLHRLILKLSARTRLATLRLEGGLGGFHPGQFTGSCYGLSEVKTLEFDHYTDGESPPSYDFLLTLFPLLENLNVFVRHNFKSESFLFLGNTRLGLLPGDECRKLKKTPLGLGREAVEIVEVNKYIYDGEMYKSNIWELIPLLKVFTFQWDVYTRHEYEAYKEKLNL